MVLKSVSSGRTRVEVEELWWEEAILNFEVWKLFFADEIMTEGLADSRFVSLIILSDIVHTGVENPQDGLRDM